MGLAPHPARVSPKEGREDRPSDTVVQAVDLSPLTTIQVRQVIDGLTWETNKRILDLIEAFCVGQSTYDTAWPVIRGQLMDRFAESQRALRQAVNTIMAQ